jgi:thiol-disulfide isomerase/thioredoxin
MVTTTSIASPEIGEKVPLFEDLRAADGESYGLSSFDDNPVVALVFIANGCPTVRVYEDRLIALQSKYGERGLQVVAINSNNPHLSPPDVYSELVKRAAVGGYNFPYLKDEDGNVGRTYGAIATPHVFVLDAERRLQYRGRIDDSRDPANITRTDLENAILDLLDGTSVQVSETQPFGCAIVR